MMTICPPDRAGSFGEQKLDIVQRLMAYENGELDQHGTIALFNDLCRSGMIHYLQGHYQRTAQRLINSGLLNPLELS